MSVQERLLDACLEQWPSSYREIIDTLMKVPGIAIIELPQPDEQGQFWYGRNHVFADSDGRVMTKHGTDFGSAEEVRTIAAALLAAADAAEAKT